MYNKSLAIKRKDPDPRRHVVEIVFEKNRSVSVSVSSLFIQGSASNRTNIGICKTEVIAARTLIPLQLKLVGVKYEATDHDNAAVNEPSDNPTMRKMRLSSHILSPSRGKI
mmetsp:Transcript_8702/g.10187  ORF Transcript_8702/g.10187 Transcript_8702/m.10187 type:complete len:111 (+) Transcript_8702:743-1075(+)